MDITRSSQMIPNPFKIVRSSQGGRVKDPVWVGTQAWEVIENFVVPVLMRVKGKDGSSMFTKVFGSCHHAAGVLDTNCFEHK